MAKQVSMKHKERVTNTIIYVILSVMSVLWVLPIIYIVYVSLRPEAGKAAISSLTLQPGTSLTFQHYADLLWGPTSKTFPFITWFFNTLIIAICVTIINTLFVLSVSYTMSRLRFKSRKTLMSINLILGMFPGFMSMIAIYNIMKLVGLVNPSSAIYNPKLALILCYSMSSGMGFYVAKGFFDTISRSLDEAARIDGATNAQVFFKIIIPLSKPIIVYTLITAFMGPWMDYIFCAYIIDNAVSNYTVALGLWKFLADNYIGYHFTEFFAGSVMISIPIMALFLATQKYYVEGVTGGAVKG